MGMCIFVKNSPNMLHKYLKTDYWSYFGLCRFLCSRACMNNNKFSCEIVGKTLMNIFIAINKRPYHNLQASSYEVLHYTETNNF